jgi:hypothetical protein
MSSPRTDSRAGNEADLDRTPLCWGRVRLPNTNAYSAEERGAGFNNRIQYAISSPFRMLAYKRFFQYNLRYCHGYEKCKHNKQLISQRQVATTIQRNDSSMD